jgi:hypothetical protein
MERVYKCCTLDICASHAEDGHGGCYGTRHPFLLKELIVHWPLGDGNGFTQFWQVATDYTSPVEWSEIIQGHYTKERGPNKSYFYLQEKYIFRERWFTGNARHARHQKLNPGKLMLSISRESVVFLNHIEPGRKPRRTRSGC